MDAADGAGIVEGYSSALNRRDMDALGRLISADVVGHEPTHQLTGLDAFKSNIDAWFSGYYEPRITTEDLFACGDRAAWRWTFDGIHAATGFPVTVQGIIIFRFERGRIAEYWGHYDRHGLLEQQGVPPDAS